MKGMKRAINEGGLLKLMSRLQCLRCNEWFNERKKECPHCGAENEDYKPVSKNAWPKLKRNAEETITS